jgi:uncharacterized repeat protein (TIGR01451 family)
MDAERGKYGVSSRVARLNPRFSQRFIVSVYPSKVPLRGTVRAALWLLLIGISTPCFGQRVAVQTELVAELRESVHSPQGSTAYRFVRATVVPQGEVVYYTVKVRNPGTAYARDVAVVQKIPENTAYVVGSASGPAVDVSFSVDGGRTFVAERKPASSDQDVAASGQYTHIRWHFRNALAPGATALARFRAIFR